METKDSTSTLIAFYKGLRERLALNYGSRRQQDLLTWLRTQRPVAVARTGLDSRTFGVS